MNRPKTAGVRRYGAYDTKLLADLIAMLAANIEDAYSLTGVPYTPKECVDLAAREVLAGWLRRFKFDEVDVHSDTTPHGPP